jgi:hypothetical protein
MVALMEQNISNSSCLKISPHLYNLMFELQNRSSRDERRPTMVLASNSMICNE